ncbi:hypothetical protein ACFOOP_02070 [Marinicaulis aureus]|uniref:DUF3592 domain-containing protein n=1 Tax=Hyphococcus aureus TaxID=2666033 RepID=A0ABW1KVX3_9PROT
MPRGFGLYLFAVGLVAFCLSAASAGERVTYNQTVLDCVPEGCFVIKYVPAPRLKPEQPNNDETSQQHEGGTGEKNNGQITIGNLSIEPVDGNTDRDRNHSDKSESNVDPWGWSLENVLLLLGPLAGWAAAWLVWLTYGQTREALNLTRVELESTRKTQEAQVRAYLTASGGEVSSYETFGEAVVSVEFTNTGNSPARDIVFYAQIIVQRFDTLETHLIRSKLADPLKINELSARETRSRDAMFFIHNFDIATKFREGMASVKVGGNLYFTDDFGKRRKVKTAVAGFVKGDPDEIGVISGNMEPVNADLWSKKHLEEIERRRRQR